MVDYVARDLKPRRDHADLIRRVDGHQWRGYPQLGSALNLDDFAPRELHVIALVGIERDLAGLYVPHTRRLVAGRDNDRVRAVARTKEGQPVASRLSVRG